ncbi:MAG: integrin alpha [Candidatus Margulisbacteria bacterium]|nr:integrin alpha [Candidatus Margulisiibacteriota bacterium]MBU1021336.1 integrin alpha [Candidatus Margulisiibacteriota bacterium]MBU1729175.1 integrin alpha [Candidatus Margulisiibacteriota bacterium]MBU1954848.1 integrin alpha [Candidatus Margulisiibacteriota bacterium]
MKKVFKYLLLLIFISLAIGVAFAGVAEKKAELDKVRKYIKLLDNKIAAARKKKQSKKVTELLTIKRKELVRAQNLKAEILSSGTVTADTSTSFAPGGALLYQKDGEAAYNLFGYAVAGNIDVNGDGYTDFMVGAYKFDNYKGSVYVYSGLNGALLQQKFGQAEDDQFGRSCAGIKDINGDDRDDFIVGAAQASPGGLKNAGSVYVYSGVNGTLLYQKNGFEAEEQFGVAVASVPDTNGDGIDDFIVGSRRASSGGKNWNGVVTLFSGANGALLYQVGGIDDGGQLGTAVAGVGDINGDGRGDFIAGAPYASLSGVKNTGAAYVFSGADGALLYQLNGEGEENRFGSAVAGIGDVNKDGYADFAVGAPIASPRDLRAAGSVYAYSGINGKLLYRLDGEAEEDLFGYALAGAGDVNGDGYNDFIIGLSNDSPDNVKGAGAVRVCSGAHGALRYQINGTVAGGRFGSAVAGAGDVNGDGKDDIIIGAPLATINDKADAGSAFVYTF